MLDLLGDDPLDHVLEAGDLGDGSEGSPRLVVDTWIGRDTSAGVELLMLLRSEAEGGFWQGVSGTVDPDDRTMRATAVREIREETGLDLQGHELIDMGRWITFRGVFSGAHLRKRTIGLALPTAFTVSDVVLSDEHVEARIVPEATALGLVRFPEHRNEIIAFAKRLSP